MTTEQHTHVAYIWGTVGGLDGAVHFAEDGLRGSDRCVLIGHKQDNARTLSVLQDRGIDVDGLRARGRLTVIERPAAAGAVPDRVAAIFRSAPDSHPVSVEELLAQLGSPTAAAALRASEERFRVLFDSAPDAIVVSDDDGRFVEVNPAACTLFGLSREGLLGRTVAEISAPELDTQSAWSAFRRTGTAEGEWKVTRPDGSSRDVEFSARADVLPGRHVSALRDVTERKRMENELRTREMFLSEGQKLSSTGSWAWTVATDELSWSRETFRIFGLSGETNKPLFAIALEAVHPEDRGDLEHEMKRAWEERSHMERLFRIVRPDGSVRHVHGRGRPVFDESGELVQFLGAMTDVTERRQAEQRLQQSYEKLQALSERLRAVREEEGSRIARSVHDEIGQALTALQMDVAWLSNRVTDIPGAAETSVAARLQSMAGLLDQVLDTVQKIATELRPGILDGLGLEAAVEWYVREFEKRAGIDCRVQCELHDAAIATRLSTAVFRILQEALTNVWRHSGATQTAVHLSLDAGQLRLDVKDNGHGLAADRVSDFRSLGLLGMQERARSLGGSVVFRGVPGQGTRVTLRIPV